MVQSEQQFYEAPLTKVFEVKVALCGTITISKDIAMVKAESYASYYIGASSNRVDCGDVYIDGQEFTSTDDALRLDDSYPLPTFDHLNAVRSADNTLLLTPKN